MPRSYKRTTEKAKWTDENLREALLFIENGGKIRGAARRFGIPYGSLQTRIKKGEAAVNGPKMGRPSVLSSEQEESIADHLKLLAKMFYGLTPQQLRKLVFEYAEENGIKNSFNKRTRMAGKDWMYDFKRRNPTISVRKPEATSINRVTAFNREEINMFFENLEGVMVKYNFQPSRIFNMDETGISNVQQPETVLAEKGQKRVGAATSAERGKTVTVICCPPDAIYNVSMNGWSNDDLFLVWLKHFVRHVKPSNEEPILLVLDNHGSHISLAIHAFCREKGIIMLSIPPHSSHRIQPLSFFGPLKKAYRHQCDLFMKTTHFTKITHYDFASIFNKAYSSVAVINKAVNGFCDTGIYPINPQIFSDEDFLPADRLLGPQQPNNGTTDIIQNDHENENNDVGQNEDDDRNDDGELMHVPPIKPQASYSNSNDSLLEDSQPGISKSNKIGVSIQDLSPIPAVSKVRKVTKGQSKKQHSEVLTSTPMKVILIEKERKKKMKFEKTQSRLKVVQKSKKKKVKNLIPLDSDTSSHSENEDISNLCDDDSDDDMSTGVQNENMCIICEEFGKNGELWFRCTACRRLAHKECTGVDSANGYCCDFCSRKKHVKRRLNS